jgi:hypothetical protein
LTAEEQAEFDSYLHIGNFLSLRPIRKLKHSILIAIVESNREEEFGGIGRQFILCSYQLSPNGRFAVWAEELGTHRELLSVVAPKHAS